MFFVALLVDQNIPEAKRINNELNDKVLKAWLLAADGRNEEILKEISNIQKHNDLGYAYAALGNEQSLYLLDSLNNSAINKYEMPFTYLDLKNNLIFDKIREEPQFQEWLKEAKVVHEERMQKYGHLFDD